MAFASKAGSLGSIPSPRNASGEFHRLSGMTSHQVGQYMAACGFADYEHLFKETSWAASGEHNISGDRLLQLTSEDLRDIGFVTVGDRLVMQQDRVRRSPVSGPDGGLPGGPIALSWVRTAWSRPSRKGLTRTPDWMLGAAFSQVGWNATNEERKSEYLKSAEVSKQKDQKAKRKALRKHRSFEDAIDLRSLRSKICQALRVAAAREDGCMGHAVLKVWQSYVQQAKDRQRLVEDRSLRNVCASRAVLSQLAVLHAWGAAVALRRYEAWGGGAGGGGQLE
eukprot:s419_g21.t1